MRVTHFSESRVLAGEEGLLRREVRVQELACLESGAGVEQRRSAGAILFRPSCDERR